MKTIIQQQLELELGENYAEYLSRGRKYLAAMITSPGFVGQRHRIFENEGGFESLLQQLLIRVIEKGSLDDGFKDFSSYLSEEYISTNNRANTHHTKWHLGADNNRPDVDEAYNPFEDSPSESSEDIPQKYPHVEQVLRTQEERDLWQLLGDMGFGAGTNMSGRQPTYGRLTDAINTLGWTRKHGMNIYHRIKQRAARLDEIDQE